MYISFCYFNLCVYELFVNIKIQTWMTSTLHCQTSEISKPTRVKNKQIEFELMKSNYLIITVEIEWNFQIFRKSNPLRVFYNLM